MDWIERCADFVFGSRSPFIKFRNKISFIFMKFSRLYVVLKIGTIEIWSRSWWSILHGVKKLVSFVLTIFQLSDY